MRPIDIRKYKQDIRAAARKKRSDMPQEMRRDMDNRIAANVRKLYQYKAAKAILIYVSTAIEIDTKQIILNAWYDGKKVAVPRCIPGTRDMEFHYINSFDDLSPGTFSVLEPSENAPIVEDFDGCLMVLPAITVDADGYRLGYGKGYYDRYMSRFKGFSVVLCYTSELIGRLHRGRYDAPACAIITEKRIKSCKKRSVNNGRIRKDN